MTPIPQPNVDDMAAAPNTEPDRRAAAWEIYDADMIWSAYAIGAALARMGQWSEDHIWQMTLADEGIQEWARDERFLPMRETLLARFDGSEWLTDREAEAKNDLGAYPVSAHARDILRAVGRDDL